MKNDFGLFILQVRTPTEPKTPEISVPRSDEDTPLHLLVANEAKVSIFQQFILLIF